MTHLLASRTVSGDILIISERLYKRGKNAIKPYITLKGHQGDGFAIQWNNNNPVQVAAGSYNGKLSVWDTNHKSTENSIHPISDFFFH